MKAINSNKRFAFNSTILLLLLLLSMPVLIQGQYWKLLGNSPTSTDFLGSKNSQDLRIRTNNLQRMVVTSLGNVGIGIASPAFKLDVNGNGNYSGTLKIGAYTLPATDGASGQLLKTNGLGTLSWQNDITGPTPWITSGSDIYNIAAVHVGIGTSTPVQKLDVTGNGYYAIGNFVNATPNLDFFGVIGTCNNTPGHGTGVGGVGGAFGIYGDAIGDGQAFGFGGNGVYGHAVNFNGGIGVYGTGQDAGVKGVAALSPGLGAGESTGVYGTSNISGSSAINIGVLSEATGSGFINYGILSSASGSTTNYAGYFEGDVVVTGTFSNPSDRKLKQDIKPLIGALDIISRLNPSVYTYRIKEFKQMNLPQGTHYGLIADELQQVVPDAVKKSFHPAEYEKHDSRNGKRLSEKVEFNSVNYIEMIPLLIGSVKEQQNIIKSLKDEVDSLRERLNGGSIINDGTVTISSINESNEALLGQNIPNPANKNTIIPFRIPKNCNSATIVITESGTGRIVKAIIVGCNETHLALDGVKLASGTYAYSLYVDGKQVDTKQLIIAN